MRLMMSGSIRLDMAKAQPGGGNFFAKAFKNSLTLFMG
jgi:hypothetical protein